ncbi:hypothetical protein B0H19DRAFT_353226 [Mycena capillaripes]|nr:hypothetical protein B0H19DRAFT_353226 [Mycena capillaripes]
MAVRTRSSLRYVTIFFFVYSYTLARYTAMYELSHKRPYLVHYNHYLLRRRDTRSLYSCDRVRSSYKKHRVSNTMQLILTFHHYGTCTPN